MTAISPTMQPPAMTVGVLGWLRKNLFSTWYNALLTAGALWLLYVLGRALVEFIFGTDWTVIQTNLRLFMVGRYPAEQVWRVQAATSLLALLAGAAWGFWGGVARLAAAAAGALFLSLALLPLELNTRLWLAANVALIALGFGAGYRTRSAKLVQAGGLLALAAAALLLYGIGSDTLPTVATDLWGGLLLTLVLALVGITASFPLGVLLAIGRQSGYPAIRWFCILYIEVIRGVPLVTILFMMQWMLPLFLAEGMTVENSVRAMAGFTLFTSAYLAENVRGGLQSIGRGQAEAARALGLNPLQTLRLIILPQALRAVIPAIVGQFISLFKDTSLAVIVSVLELTGIARSVASQREFLDRQAEVYVFIAAIYFIGASSMSYASRRLEKALGVGERY